MKISDVKSQLNTIEANYKVSSIKVNNFFLWPHLRYFIGKLLTNTAVEKENKKKKINRIQRFKNCFYGIFNVFRHQKKEYFKEKNQFQKI